MKHHTEISIILYKMIKHLFNILIIVNEIKKIIPY